MQRWSNVDQRKGSVWVLAANELTKCEVPHNGLTAYRYKTLETRKIFFVIL